MPIEIRDFANIKQEDRYYPSEVPLFDYEPLKKYFQIVKSPEPVNEGIISLVSFKEEDLICKWTGFHLTFQTLHSLQHTEDKVFIHDPYFCGKMLHSCDPNSYLNMDTMEIKALKCIKPFDKLTLNYNKTEKALYQAFHCQCGSDGCIGWVSGYSNK